MGAVGLSSALGLYITLALCFFTQLPPALTRGEDPSGPAEPALEPRADSEDDDPMEYFQIKTPAGEKHYQFFWLTTENQRLRLRIKGKQGAHIALAQTPHISEDNAYEIVIGAHSPPNQSFLIRKKVKGPNEVKKEWGKILNTQEYRAFWITWDSNTITIGLGNQFGVSKALSWEDKENPLTVTALSMDTFEHSDLTWQILRDSVRDLFVWGNAGNKNSAVWFTEPHHKRFTFGARGCQQAKLGLSDSDDLDQAGKAQTHVIILGFKSNEMSVIKEQIADANTDLAAEASTPGILSCSEMRYFWVSWDTGRIQVGYGLRVGDNMFLNWQPEKPHEIRSVTPFFGNEAGPNPEFHFRNVEENYYLLRTQSDYNMSFTHAVNIEQHTVFVFRVHACYDAVLDFRRKYAEHTAGTPHHIRITLGTKVSDGQKSEINFMWDNGESDMPFYKDTPDILSCDAFRNLWLAWKNAFIRVGRGEEPYVNEIFKMRDPYLPFSVERLYLGSLTSQHQVEWQFSRSQASIMTLRTLPSPSIGQAWMTSAERRDFVFKVMTSTLVEIVMATYVGNAHVSKYTLRISNDLSEPLRSGIWREDNTAGGEFQPTIGILAQDELRPFWVSWHEGNVAFGQGIDPGFGAIVTYRDPTKDTPLEVSALSLSSAAIATWEIGQEYGEEYIVRTPKADKPRYNTFWLVTHSMVFPFKVKAEKLCYIVLSKIPGQAAKDAIEIIIGINGKTEIHVAGTGDNAVEDTPDVLSDSEHRPLWVTWGGNVVSVGKGLPRQGLLVSLNVSIGYEIRGLSLSSGATFPAEWVFSTTMGTEARMFTGTQYKYDQLWRTVTTRTNQIFRVRAKSDANILLAMSPWRVQENVYEITIGKDGNTKSVIRDGTHLAGGPDLSIKATEDTAEVLSNVELRTFWISWAMGDIRLGAGPEVGANTLVSWLDVDPHPVHALSIATDKGASGTWELYQITGDTGDVYHFVTLPVEIPQTIMTSKNDHVSFTIWACSPAEILLLADVGQISTQENQVYRVVIGLNNDSHVAIYQARGITWLLKVEETYPDVLRCGYPVNFWVGWRQNLIQLGRGRYPHNVILQYYERSKIALKPINAFSFLNAKSTMPTHLQWELDKGAVDYLSYLTTGPKTYNAFWMSVYRQDYLVLNIRSCSSAWVALTQLAAVAELNAYEIEIDINWLTIDFRIYSEGKKVADGSTANIVACEKDKHFWIGWQNDTIEVGMGTMFGSSKQVKYQDDNAHEVNFLAFASTNLTQWVLQHIQGNMYGFESPAVSDNDRPSYDYLWLVPPRHRKVMTLSIAADFDARIALAAESGSLEKAYEVVLANQSSGSEQLSSIRDSIGGKDLATHVSEGYLDAAHHRTFWISWDGGQIRVGFGAPDTLEFLKWKPFLWGHPIRALALGAGASRPVNWRFSVDEVEAMHAITVGNRKDEDRLWVSVQGRDSIFFQVKTCKHAQIYLTAIPYETRAEAYLIELSTDDGYAKIVDLGTNRVISQFPVVDVVTCALYRGFWITWRDNELLVGRGSYIGDRVLLQAIVTSLYPITSVGMDTYEQETGLWNVLRNQGNVYRTYTSKDLNYGSAIMKITKRTSMPFTLRACANAYVLLAADFNDWTKDTLELVIGSFDNTKVELRYKSINTPVKVVEAPDILSCTHLRRYWISWNKGEIKFGTGREGSHEVLVWRFHEPGGLPMPFSLHYITVATVGNEGEWELEQRNPGDSCGRSFRKISGIAEGLASACYHLKGIAEILLNECFIAACQNGANMINFKNNICNLKRCADVDDPKLSDWAGGWEVFALHSARDSFIALTSKQLGLNYDQHWVTVGGFTSLPFKVRACSDVHLALAAVPANSETLAFEIIIGGWSNTHSAIRAKAGLLVDPEVKTYTPGVLLCGATQHLWISWDNNFIQAGSGPVVGMHPFVEWRPDSPIFEINAVGVSSAVDHEAVFMFGNMEDEIEPPYSPVDESYIMLTDGSGEFKTHRWTISASYFLFDLMACADARIVLAEVPGEYTKSAYLIELGTSGNKKTRISKLPNGSMDPEESDTPEVLNCTTPQPFWVEILPTGIVIGQGPRGPNTLVAFTDLQMPKLSEVAVTTGSDQRGFWDVRESAGHVFKFQTPDSKKYWEVWRTTQNAEYIVFKVKACNDAHILLSRSLENQQNVFEVALGINGGSYNVIRECPQCPHLVEERTPGVVSCSEFRAFWIRFSQGVEVGYGSTVGQRPLMRLHYITSFPVGAISVMTGWGAVGEWHFSDIDGDSFFLTSAPSYVYQHVWLHEETHYFQFDVRSCQSANIFLGESNDPKGKGYEIHLEGSDGAQSYLKVLPEKEGESPYKSNSSTSGIVNCLTFSSFWVSWLNGMVRVGRGPLLENTFLLFMDERDISIHALSLMTPMTQDEPTEWQFPKNAGKSVIFITFDGKEIVDWLTVDEVQFTYVKVKTCSDAELLITSSAGVSYGYTIVVGRNGKQTVLLAPGVEEPVSFSDGNPLSCDVGVWFWLSWSNKIIAFGQGLESGFDVLVAYNLVDSERPLEVGAIGFRTLKSVGTWEFTKYEDREFEVTTAHGKGYKHAWLLTSGRILHFKIRACRNAMIALSEESDITSLEGQKAYELIIGSNETKRIEVLKYAKDGTSKQLHFKDFESELLNCDAFTPMWLSWQDDEGKRVFQLGRGPDLYSDEIYKFEDTTDPYKVAAVGFATEDSKTGEWVFQDDAALLTRFHTDTLFYYGKVLYHVTSLGSFVFKVRAKKDAHIVLFEHHHTDKAYEFVLGMSDNKYTIIREKPDSDPVAFRPTPDILSENEYRQFWITWWGDRLSIGRGHIPGRDAIVDWTPKKMLLIQYLSISTWNSVAGDWEFMPQSLDTMLIKTPNTEVDTTVVTYTLSQRKTEFPFKVKACEQAKVKLLEDWDQELSTYELVLGADGNTKTKLFKRGEKVSEQVMLDVLHCSEFRSFWLSWDNGFIEVAQGSKMGLRVLTYQDPTISPVHSLSLSTGLGQEGDWSVMRYVAPRIRYEAAANRSRDGFWLTVAGTYAYIFRIRGKGPANVLLSQVPALLPITTYEIIIGADFNLATTIWELKNNTRLGLKETAGILTEREFRWFWVTWGPDSTSPFGRIKFGKGTLLGQEEVISADLPAPFSVNAIGLTASNNKGITWELLVDSGNSYLLYTKGLSYETGAWVTPMNRTFIFRVAACRDARVALLADRTDMQSGYELVFGGLDNTATGLYHGVMGQELVLVQGSGILECGAMRTFWVSWDASDIRVGEGHIDSEPFINYKTRNSIGDINVIGFASDSVSAAEWAVPQDQESALLLSTSPNETYGQHWMTLAGRSSAVLRVKVCHSARILLVATPDNALTDATEIIIGRNGKTVLLSGINGTERSSADTADILDCNHYSAFWITWFNQTVAMGMGTILNQGTLVSYSDEKLHDILALGLATGPAKENEVMERGLWQIFQLRGNTIKVHTPAEKTYEAMDLVPANPDQFTLNFRVRTCMAAHIMMAPETSDESQVYEIIIGAEYNTKHIVKKGGKQVDSVLYYNTLSAYQFRPFWLDWRAGNLTVAFNDVPIISYVDPNPAKVYATSVSTWNLCDGDWDIDQNIGDVTYVQTPGDHVYDKVHLMVMDTYSFVFKVKAARHVHIALSAVPGMTRAETYEIGIQGGTRATDSFIREGVNGRIYLASKTTTDLLSATAYHNFWISWDKETIQIGQGPVVGFLKIVGATVTGLPDIASASFTTSDKVVGDWQFGVEGRVPTTSTTTTSTTTTPTTPTTTTLSSTTSNKSPPTSGLSSTVTSSTTSRGEEVKPPPPPAGLSGGQTAGIVIGVILGLLLLILIVTLVMMRYRPEMVPKKVTIVVPEALQKKVSRDGDLGAVHFTNPIFGDGRGLSQNRVAFGSMDGQPLNTFGPESTT